MELQSIRTEGSTENKLNRIYETTTNKAGRTESLDEEKIPLTEAPAQFSTFKATSELKVQAIHINLFIYLGFYVAFNTVQVISRRVVGRAEETSTYSSLGFCTVNCRPTASNYQLSHVRP